MKTTILSYLTNVNKIKKIGILNKKSNKKAT